MLAQLQFCTSECSSSIFSTPKFTRKNWPSNVEWLFRNSTYAHRGNWFRYHSQNVIFVLSAGAANVVWPYTFIIQLIIDKKASRSRTQIIFTASFTTFVIFVLVSLSDFVDFIFLAFESLSILFFHIWPFLVSIILPNRKFSDIILLAQFYSSHTMRLECYYVYCQKDFLLPRFPKHIIF